MRPASVFALNDAPGLPRLLSDGTRKYVYGPQGLAYTVDITSAAVSYAHSDGLGSVRALSDASGAVVQTYRTDAWGNPDAALTAGTSAQPIGYTGEQRLQGGSGLVDLRARVYDLSLGRFLQQDRFRRSGPGVGGFSPYRYTANNPTNLVVPSGHSAAQKRLNQASVAFVGAGRTRWRRRASGPWSGVSDCGVVEADRRRGMHLQ